MNKQIEQINQEEDEELTCPECGKGFQDMRGLTSHARHYHKMSKIQIREEINKGGTTGKVLGRVGFLVLAIITLGRFK